MAGIREILLITSRDLSKQFEELLGDGSDLGISIAYEVQEKPEGIAQAFTIGSDFIGSDRVAFVLGYNFFHGRKLQSILDSAVLIETGAIIFTVPVDNPKEFGVAEVDSYGVVLTLQEKTVYPKSCNAVPGLYFYDNSVVDIARNLKKSNRGEYEITDVNLDYLNHGQLSAIKFDPDTMWFDTGTPRALLNASHYVAEFQQNNDDYIGCIEQVAFEKNFIDIVQFRDVIANMPDIPYKSYLHNCIN